MHHQVILNILDKSSQGCLLTLPGTEVYSSKDAPRVMDKGLNTSHNNTCHAYISALPAGQGLVHSTPVH